MGVVNMIWLLWQHKYIISNISHMDAWVHHQNMGVIGAIFKGVVSLRIVKISIQSLWVAINGSL